MAETIALVSCVKSKQACPAPAADLYTSPLFRKMRAYAERHADRWFVLSARHGLVHPATVVEPYEETLNNAPIARRREWASHVLQQMAAAELLRPHTAFLWLAGRRYMEHLARKLQMYEQHDPMKGMAIGRRLAWLTS